MRDRKGTENMLILRRLDGSSQQSHVPKAVWAIALALPPVILLLNFTTASGENLIPAIALTILAAVIRLQQGTWLAPGAFFALVWTSYVWIALLLAGEVEVWQGAIWWIVACVAVTYLGTFVGAALGGKSRAITVEPSQHVRWPALRPIILLLSALGFGSVLVLIQSAGRGISALFSLESLSQMASDLSVYRYSSGYTEPMLERVFTVAIYLASLLAGLLMATSPSRSSRRLALLVVMSAVSVALVTTTKASVFWALILVTASYLAARAVVSAEPVRLFTWSRVWMAGLGVVGVVTFSVLVQMLRYQYASSQQALQVLSVLRVDFFGYLGVFSDWFQRGAWQQSHLGWGAYSFAGLFQLVGIQARSPGLYGDMAYLGPERIPSNTFTIFRSLIEDFGTGGSLVTLLAVGLTAGLAFSASRNNRVLSIPILSAFYATTLWSHTLNLFSYSTMVFAWVLFASYLLIARPRPESRPRPVRNESDMSSVV